MRRLVNAVMSGYMPLRRPLPVTGSLATILWLVTLRREKLDVGTWTFLGVVANIWCAGHQDHGGTGKAHAEARELPNRQNLCPCEKKRPHSGGHLLFHVQLG